MFLKVSEALGIKHGIFIRVPLIIGQFFTNLIQYLPERVLYRLGILSKLDNDTIEMMTKGSTGDNSEWLEKTSVQSIYLFDAYKNLADSSEANEKYIQSIRDN